MKKIWGQYSFAIILILLSCSFAFVLSFQSNTNDEEKYIKVKVSTGDSIWELSNQYASQHTLSNKEFVSWVKKHNPNIEDQIYPGEELIIPVNKEAAITTTELASAIGE